FKAETLKGITLNEPSSAPARGNKSSSASKTNSAPAGKLKNVKVEDDPPLARYHIGQSESSSRSRPSRPVMPFPSCIHYGYNDHQSDNCVYYPICAIYGSYDHDTHGYNRIISLRRGIEPKKLKKFDFIIEDGRHIYLTKKEINYQKKLEEDAKAEAAKQEREVRKAELVDLLSPEVLKKYYNDKLQYDKYCDKMLNRRPVSRITNCDVLTRKGPITLKVYREDGTSEIIPNFKASTRIDYINTTKTELGINLDIPLSKQDPLNKLSNLVNKKRKHADDIHDYFKANKRLKSSVKYKDHLPEIILQTLNQGHRLDDRARTFSSLLVAEIDMRKLNLLKQMRVIVQLRQ
ncbi:hypothetical protein Tco_1185821, partial [Tanacetum coccineum]